MSIDLLIIQWNEGSILIWTFSSLMRLHRKLVWTEARRLRRHSTNSTTRMKMMTMRTMQKPYYHRREGVTPTITVRDHSYVYHLHDHHHPSRLCPYHQPIRGRSHYRPNNLPPDPSTARAPSHITQHIIQVQCEWGTG